ncbi:MAG: hypothetical protein V8R52_09585 [Coprobacter fastidiosus]
MINTFLVKGGALIVGLLTTPAYMRFFDNNSVLGVWYTMLSVLTWVLYFDLGVGNGLRNKLVEAIAKKDTELQKKYISSAYLFLSAIALIVAIVLLIICQFVNWNVVLNVSQNDLSCKVLTNAVTIVLCGILIQFVLRLISSIMYAIQKAFIPNFLSLCTNLMMLFYVLVSNKVERNNSIINLSWAYLIASVLPMLIASIYVFTSILKDVRPNVKFYNKKCAAEVFRTGVGFLVLQIAGMLIGNSFVVYLITILLNSASVVEFNIYYKIYSNIYMLFSILMTPIWSAVTKAMANNRFEWIKKMMIKLRLGLIIIFAAQFIMVPIMQFVFDIWLGDQTINANVGIQVAFIINNGIMMLYLLTAQICNGLGELKIQVRWYLTANILLLMLSIIFTRIVPHYTAVIYAQSIG